MSLWSLARCHFRLVQSIGLQAPLRFTSIPSERILKRRAAKRLPKDTNAGQQLVNQEWLEQNFEGELSDYDKEVEEVIEKQITVYDVCAYNKRRWLKDFISDHNFRRGIVLPGRRLIFEEDGAKKSVETDGSSGSA